MLNTKTRLNGHGYYMIMTVICPFSLWEVYMVFVYVNTHLDNIKVISKVNNIIHDVPSTSTKLINEHAITCSVQCILLWLQIVYSKNSTILSTFV